MGAGGHAKVAAEAWASRGGRVFGFHDDQLEGAHILGSCAQAFESADELHIAIGDNVSRRRLAASIADARFPLVAHARAIVSPSATVGAGTLLCAAAILQPGAHIGRHVIINTATVVEHDCRVADFVHLAPGVRLAGGVTIGEASFLGTGAVVIPGVQIGLEAVIGAGSVVIRDVPDGARVVGNPARRIG